MVYQEPSSRHGWVRVTFTCPTGLWVDQLSVVGDFNDWDQHATPLAFTRDGAARTVTVELPAGQRFRFAYLADGARCLEPGAEAVVFNAPGGAASVLVTRPPVERKRYDATARLRTFAGQRGALRPVR